MGKKWKGKLDLKNSGSGARNGQYKADILPYVLCK